MAASDPLTLLPENTFPCPPRHQDLPVNLHPHCLLLGLLHPPSKCWGPSRPTSEPFPSSSTFLPCVATNDSNCSLPALPSQDWQTHCRADSATLMSFPDTRDLLQPIRLLTPSPQNFLSPLTFPFSAKGPAFNPVSQTQPLDSGLSLPCPAPSPLNPSKSQHFCLQNHPQSDPPLTPLSPPASSHLPSPISQPCRFLLTHLLFTQK